MFNRIVEWLIGKKILTATGQMSGTSKTKLTALVAVILAAIPPISAAWNHPIVIPDWVYKILAAGGLWTLRDAIPPKQG